MRRKKKETRMVTWEGQKRIAELAYQQSAMEADRLLSEKAVILEENEQTRHELTRHGKKQNTREQR